MTNISTQTSLYKAFAAWLAAGLFFIIIGSVCAHIFNVPFQQVKFNEFLLLLQGLIFLGSGLWLLGRSGLSAETAILNTTGLARSCGLAAKYFLIFFLATGFVIGFAWLIIYLSPQASENFNNDYARVANDISRQNDYLFGTVFQSPLRVAIYLLGTCVLIPIEEELFFRRFFYVAIREKLGLLYGVIISSAMFGLMHPGSPLLGVLMGVFLALIYERHKNLLVNFTTHGLVNFFVIVAKDVIVPYFK